MSKNLILILGLLLVSCKPQSEKVVSVLTSAILEPVSMTSSLAPDLDELEVSPDEVTITLTIKNNSSTTIKQMILKVGSGQSLIKQQIGTCGSTLQSGSSCTYLLSFIPKKLGVFNIPVTFDYENLIEAQSKSISYNGIIGEPATLAFTDEAKSNNDFGVIEQTIALERFQDIEIQNVGGLSARNVLYSLSNTNANGAFRIVTNNCPTKIKPTIKCNIRIGYTPHNNNYSDLEVNYSGQLLYEYGKNPKLDTSRLNSYFKFLSTTIEAKFKENFNLIEFSKLITGNKESKTVKLSNIGYEKGIIKELQFKNYLGVPVTSCKKAISGQELDCQKSLAQFPFVVEDLNNCVENEVNGVVGKIPGGSCYFKITYWPSVTYLSGTQATNYFNESFIDVLYDSQWFNNITKSKTNLVTKVDVFKILAEFTAAGKLVLEDVLIDGVSIYGLVPPVLSITNTWEADLERIALVSDINFKSFIQIKIKNIGESAVTFTSIRDGKSTPNFITSTSYNLNAFYNSIKHVNCDVVVSGASCEIGFDLNPLNQVSQAANDVLMYDDISNLLKKMKKFIVKYNDGSSFEDRPAITAVTPLEQSIDIRLIAKLVTKGVLQIVTPNVSFPAIINGNSSTKTITLKNVGTGEIYAIVKDSVNNLDALGGGILDENWPYEVKASAPLAGTDFDCYNLIYAKDSTPKRYLPLVPDTSKFLAQNKTCSLTVENKVPETLRIPVTNYTGTTAANNTFFSNLVNSPSELWQRTDKYVANVPLSFVYYDGDNNSDVPASVPYGYIKKTSSITLSSSFLAPPSIIIKDPLPSTSAVIRRPQIDYPSVSSSYPKVKTLAATSVPVAYFDYIFYNPAQTLNGFIKSSSAINYVKNLNLTNSTYVVHAGTFPINTTSNFQFTFTNIGGFAAINTVMTEDAGGSTFITNTKYRGSAVKPFLPSTYMANMGSGIMEFSFTPTSAGTYSRCYTLTYPTRLPGKEASRDQKVCVYARAIAAAPKMKIEYSDVAVTQVNSTTVAETQPNPFVQINTPINSTDITSFASFSAVKNSIVYSKKRIKITNIGNAAATKFNYYYMDSPINAITSIPSHTVLDVTGLAKPCSTNMTIAANDFCELYLKFTPVTGTASVTDRYIGTIFEIEANSDQYISYTGMIKFLAVDPANLVMNMGVASESITDWSTPASPLALPASWPINIGSYSSAFTPLHMLLSSNRTTKSITNIIIRNTSALKAKFIPLTAMTSAAWNKIYSTANIDILANRFCFFGDDETNPAVLAADKGFNLSSVGICRLQFDFKGFQNYSTCTVSSKAKTTTFGESIIAACNPHVYTLPYYNFSNTTLGSIIFHMKGFIEPDRVQATTPVLTNVTSTFSSGSYGSVSFTWPTLTPLNSSWDDTPANPIIRYRVYYDKVYDNLKTTEIFKLASTNKVDTVNDSIKSITINNLSVGSYYFFKVVAIRKYGAVEYVSNSNIPILSLPIPQSTQLYNDSLKTLVDKSYKTYGNRTVGVNTCAADYYSLSIRNVNVKSYKTLINTPTFNYLITSPTLSSYTGGDEIGVISHWLSDADYNLASTISLYDGTTLPSFPNYNPMSLSGDSEVNNLLYIKNTTVDKVYKIVGGDGSQGGLPYKGTAYITATGIDAFFRCQAIIPCPTNTAILITSGSCAQP